MRFLKKPMDLNSLVSSYNSLTEETFNELLIFFDFDLRTDEIEQISMFIDNLEIEDKYFGYFYLGYKIPQIDKEFDLLRFGENYILNVEIKSILKADDAKEQLIMNRYYLASLGKKIKSFTYVAEHNSLYQLDDDENFQQIQFDVFEKHLSSQKLEHHSNLDELFDPSNYLVSPFNDSERFNSGSYFLTKQQQEFKKAILNSSAKFTIIEGLPGTGKTLLLYDLAKEFIEDYNTVIIHTGTLNTGHLKLKQQYKWNIIPIKDYIEIEHIKPKFIFVDETQRMRPHQLDYLIRYVIGNDVFCIFSIDPKQILSLQEWNYDNKSTLMTLEDIEEYKLSKKIRTNKELGAFIKGLFSLKNMKYCNNTDNISIHYFNDISQARGFAEGLEIEGWQVIDYTGENWNGQLIEKMRLYRGLNAHGVLGQEFDKVLVLVGSTFYYNEDGGLAVRHKNHYDPERMFYQSVTRARKKIMLLIVNNPEFMTKLTNELNKKKKQLS
ncbi:DNA/RNA helicase domain-containing protein [Bacillus alkalicellulosilyticus]|uniref:DNA/RNA helicase domain-containing protein n=1 Tax=Alkalihalobacterium alkalicellulosilyticum TaxID=1912214 RepID=UPI001FE4C052|nr:DNA/RNA helicase domain-containing protein [Bacillus alkalicellulosilyticus]